MGRQIDTYRDSGRLFLARADETRLHGRQPFTSAVKYAVVDEASAGASAQQVAEIVDISRQGLGIKTNAPLLPGHVVRLQNDREDLRGLVRWSEPEGTSGRYRAGLQLLQRVVFGGRATQGRISSPGSEGHHN